LVRIEMLLIDIRNKICEDTFNVTYTIGSKTFKYPPESEEQ